MTSPLDGNVLAGALGQVFVFDITTAMATCAGCGQRGPGATWAAYVDAPGLVARCTNCDAVQLRLVHDGAGRVWLDLSGIAVLEYTER